jgi:hypothetical protein
LVTNVDVTVGVLAVVTRGFDPTGQLLQGRGMFVRETVGLLGLITL